MGINLAILGIQAIPRLAEKWGVSVDFPRDAFQVALQSVETFRKLLEKCEKIVEAFFEDFQASWWDVYANSDIGLERMAIAQEMLLNEQDTLLDVGCGRGYFSIAAAKMLKLVIGLDLMDGYGRHGWWRNYRDSMSELDLLDKIIGVRSGAEHLPFEDGSFHFAASVHAIRNFQDYGIVEAAIREMKRVVKSGGNVVVVESLPISRNQAQQAHLEMFRCKVKYTSGELDYPSKDCLTRMFQNVGFKRIDVKELDYNWSAAPPVFSIDPYLPSLSPSEREKAKEAYEKAAALIEKWGEASPPALFVKGTK